MPSRLVLVALSVAGLSLPRVADGQGLDRRLGGANGPTPTAAEPNRPAPRLADGKPDLSGVWTGGGGNETVDQILKPGELESIMQPWARKVFASRDDGQDPYNWCMPGGPLRITGGFAWRFVQHPTVNSTHIFMLQEGNAHTYRQIFMDGRSHPDDPSPSWYGHSIGRWDGDTLVIDTVGLHDRFWLDGSGAPHTEQLHVVERWTRVNHTTLRREVTIDDPGAYTRPFTVSYTARLATPESEIMEYICIENNQYGLAQGLQAPTPGETEK